MIIHLDRKPPHSPEEIQHVARAVLDESAAGLWLMTEQAKSIFGEKRLMGLLVQGAVWGCSFKVAPQSLWWADAETAKRLFLEIQRLEILEGKIVLATETDLGRMVDSHEKQRMKITKKSPIARAKPW